MRIFCTKHKKIIFAYPKNLYDKKYKGTNLISKSNNCNCEFTKEYAHKYRVFNKITYHLRDKTEIKRNIPDTQIKYELVR